MLGNSYVNEKIQGFKYIEDATPYASHFRPSTPLDFDEIMQLNLGKTSEFPTSTKLFYDAFFDRFGTNPSSSHIIKYAAYDILEAAIYQSFEDPRTEGNITASDVYQRLRINKVTTPLGLVGFDNDQISTLTDIVMLQVQTLQSEDIAEIVAPSGVRSSNLIYPMPTWDERVYKWSLTDGSSQEISIAVAAVCTALLSCMVVTAFIFREDVKFKMMNHWHILFLCLAAVVICWAAAFAWQGDVVQAQCDAYLWVIFVPASFMLSLICFKAYRLSLIMLAAKKRNKMRPFTQAKVLQLSFIPVIFTIILLLIIALADPPSPHKVVVDKLRPKLDYHVCESSELATSLLSIVAAMHILFSMFCVSAVREGGDSFEDGLLMKEAFIIFYGLLAVLLVLSSLDLENDDLYVLRSVILCLAATGFCVRLLLNRCLEHWLPEKLHGRLTAFIKRFSKTKVSSESLANRNSANNQSVIEDMNDFQAEVAAARSTDITAMIEALKDPTRRINFCEAADKAFVGENTRFLCAVIDFKEEAMSQASTATVPSCEWAKKKAAEINTEYCAQNAPNEVNISSSVRNRLKGKLDKWADGPLMSTAQFELALGVEGGASSHMHTDVFHGAVKEIGLMLYQNIWTKFKNDETALLACEGVDSVKVYSAKM